MFSETMTHHFTHPHCMGPLEGANHVGQDGLQGQGPYMKISFCVNQDIVVKASFETYGCPSAIACGSWLTQWAEGRNRVDVLKINAEDLMIVLGGLPLGKEHCAYMTVRALQDAFVPDGVNSETS